ncbi:MAG: hypothetical protein ACRD5K_00890 [Candidatus Acidiferrales bacterium]
MFLCPTPADASGLWLGWTLAASDGISIDYSSEANSAKRESCFRVNSDHLKPTGVKAGELFISDGSSSGFATSEYYVLYMQSHKVETK